MSPTRWERPRTTSYVLAWLGAVVVASILAIAAALLAMGSVIGKTR